MATLSALDSLPCSIPMPILDSPYLDKPAVARFFGVSERTVDRLRASGHLGGTKVRGQVRFTWGDVIRYLAKNITQGDRDGASSSLVFVDELVNLTEGAASDINHIVSLTDPIDRPTDITDYMAHECARDARSTLSTMRSIIEHMRRRESRRAADDVDPVTGAMCGGPT